MKNINKFIEFDFHNDYVTECRFDSSTVNYDEISYQLAIMHLPFGNKAPNLHFSYLTGLCSENEKDTDIVSQLLSIYQLHISHDLHSEEKYNQALILFFNKYGFLMKEDNSEVSIINRAIIDSFLKLVYTINEMYNIMNMTSPIPSDKCDRLLDLITELTFLDFGYSSLGLSSFPLNQYLVPASPDYDPDEELFYEMKGTPIAYQKQIDDYNCEEKYDAEYVITHSHSYLSKHISDNNMKVVDFFYNHLGTQHFSIETDKYNGHNYLSIHNFPYKTCEQELISVADQICNYFLSQACKSSPLIVDTQCKNGVYNRELKYQISNLSDAILLSMLFFNPTRQEFRKCSLPNCSNYFLTNRSNMKKLYCCRSHTRTAATHRYRENK